MQENFFAELLHNHSSNAVIVHNCPDAPTFSTHARMKGEGQYKPSSLAARTRATSKAEE
jgi:hypothetical protein